MRDGTLDFSAGICHIYTVPYYGWLSQLHGRNSSRVPLQASILVEAVDAHIGRRILTAAVRPVNTHF